MVPTCGLQHHSLKRRSCGPRCRRSLAFPCQASPVRSSRSRVMETNRFRAMEDRSRLKNRSKASLPDLTEPISCTCATTEATTITFRCTMARSSIRPVPGSLRACPSRFTATPTAPRSTPIVSTSPWPTRRTAAMAAMAARLLCRRLTRTTARAITAEVIPTGASASVLALASDGAAVVMDGAAIIVRGAGAGDIAALGLLPRSLRYYRGGYYGGYYRGGYYGGYRGGYYGGYRGGYYGGYRGYYGGYRGYNAGGNHGTVHGSSGSVHGSGGGHGGGRPR